MPCVLGTEGLRIFLIPLCTSKSDRNAAKLTVKINNRQAVQKQTSADEAVRLETMSTKKGKTFKAVQSCWHRNARLV